MKKIIYQISLVILIMILGMMSIAINSVEASVASINCSGATVGGTFTVSFGLPSGSSGIQGNITVTFSDGSKQSGKIIYAGGYDEANYPNSATFTATAAGTATIEATGIEISSSSGEVMEQGGSTSKQITISGGASSTAETTPSTTTSSATATTATTTEPEPTFTSVNETVYAIQSCNVRSSYSTTSNKVGGLQVGQEITRTGIGSNGWSKISYNGTTAYVKTTLLTKEEPVKEEEEEETEEVQEGENEVLVQLQNEIGVLPEVGSNIAVKFYIIVSLISISSACYLGFKLKKN